MLYNHHIDHTLSIKDYLDVMWHGIPLDLSVTGYILGIYVLMIFLTHYNDKAKTIRSFLFIISTCLSILLSVIFVADTVLYDFWRFKLDSSVFLYTDKPSAAFASVSTWFLVWCIVAIIFFSAILATAYILITKQTFKTYISAGKSNHNPSPNRMAAPSLSGRAGGEAWRLGGAVVCLSILFLMARGGIDEGTANVSDAYYSNNRFLNHSAVNPVFNFIYSLGKSQDFAHEFHTFNPTEREQLISGIYHTESIGSDTILLRKRPNILLVVWEGCGSKLVEAAGGEHGITPNLNKLAREGIIFTNCYADSYRTDRGLVSIMSGWLSLPTASLMKIPEKCETLPSLPRKLQEAGYRTEFWYGGDITFTNMYGYLLQSGIQHIVSNKDFSYKDRSYSKWGVPDDVLLSRVTKDIVNRSLNPVYQKGPWFTTVLTLSSHEPWTVPVKILSEMRRNSFAYTDMCLGRMMDKIKASDQWNDLLVIILPDHGVLLDEGDDVYFPSVIRIPIVLTGGAVLGLRRYNMIMNQSDLAATILGQLGISHDDFTFSRDVLSRGYRYPSAFHCFNNGMTFIDSTGITTFDNNAKRTIYNKGKKVSIREHKAKAILQTLYENVANR